MILKPAVRTVSIAVILSSALFTQGQAQDAEIEQWVLSLVAASAISPGGSLGNPSQVIGVPNSTCTVIDIEGATYEANAARVGRTEDSGAEWLEVRYGQQVFARAIEVHEGLNPGAVTRILVRNQDGQLHEVWNGEDPTVECGDSFRVQFPSLSFPTSVVRVELNTALVPGWNHIDAIRLIGFPGASFTPLLSQVQKDLLQLPSTLAPYVFGDYDNDGWPDIYGVDASTDPHSHILLHNEGNGDYVDRTDRLPTRSKDSNSGGILGDYDNDGDLDLFVAGGSIVKSTRTSDILYKSDRGKLVDVTIEAGLSGSKSLPLPSGWITISTGY